MRRGYGGGGRSFVGSRSGCCCRLWWTECEKIRPAEPKNGARALGPVMWEQGMLKNCENDRKKYKKGVDKVGKEWYYIKGF